MRRIPLSNASRMQLNAAAGSRINLATLRNYLSCQSQAEAQSLSGPLAALPISERLCLGTVLLLFFVAALHSARLRPLWFDELSTLFMVSTPTLGAMFHAIPTDGNPPLYFILARLFLHLPLSTEFALRLPALLAYLVAALTVYQFVRRNVNRSFAFLSLGLFLGCSFRHYAVEARAYSLLLAFTGLALTCWQSYCRTKRLEAIIGLGLSVAGCILTHQYGAIYAALPIIIGEAIRSLRSRTLDLRVLAAIACPSLILAFTYPVMLSVQKPLLAAIRACPVFFSHPKVADLKDYALTLPPLVPILLSLAVLALLLQLAILKPALATPRIHVPLEDVAAACTLSFFIPIMLIATHLGTNFFQTRYGIGSSMGVSMLSGILLGRISGRSAISVAWAAAAYSLCVGLAGIWLAAQSPNTSPWLDPVLQAGDLREPVVIASALQFSPLWWYGKDLRGRVHYLADLGFAGQHSDLVPEYSLALEQDYTPMHMEGYGPFLKMHRHFLLYIYGEPKLEWIRERLVQDGWHLTLLAAAKEKVHDDLRSDYRELYSVTR